MSSTDVHVQILPPDCNIALENGIQRTTTPNEKSTCIQYLKNNGLITTTPPLIINSSPIVKQTTPFIVNTLSPVKNTDGSTPIINNTFSFKPLAQILGVEDVRLPSLTSNSTIDTFIYLYAIALIIGIVFTISLIIIKKLMSNAKNIRK